MELNKHFINRIREEFADEADVFLNALATEPITSIRVNARKISHEKLSGQVPWCTNGMYLDKRPVFTLDPIFNAGGYYVQEASSMFVEQFFKRYVSVDSSTVVLDLCASPGGKSTHLASLLDGRGLLVSNEVVKTRVGALRENLTKWGYPNVVVTNSEPSSFGKCDGLFDVILVDAPCSGEGMFRKDEQAVTEWSPENVKMCAERQRSILKDVFPSLKEGGILIYSTCTFNKEEDENTVRWICSELGGDLLTVPYDDEWGIVGDESGLHFYPYKAKGEGFFIAGIKKNTAAAHCNLKTKPQKQNLKLPKKQIDEWIVNPSDFDYTVTADNMVIACPKAVLDVIVYLKQNLHVVQSGVAVAQIKGADLLPAAPLALSTIINEMSFNKAELSWAQAMAFLKKEMLLLPDVPKGWVLLTYQGVRLGWVKNLGNRTNNAYPAEWHVRMQADQTLYNPIF